MHTNELTRESVAPDGARYPIPSEAEELAALEQIQIESRAFDEVVVVQGLGFVGAAVAAAVSAVQRGDRARYFVIGTDLPTPGAYWKVGKIREGVTPFQSPDPAMGALIEKAARDQGNLRATTLERAYGIANVIIVDVPLNVKDRTAQTPGEIEIDLRSFEQAIRAIGREMRGDALVLVETTVPIGTTERVVYPILTEERARRGLPPPLLAHSYERVMPGPRYIDSIRRFWRSFAGVDQASSARAREFLSAIIETESFPLCELASPTSSELGKLLENAYRATNIAFVHEWTLMAEALGVNLFEVVESIHVRKGTHDNLRYPGFGVGGYCLTKDSLLAQWSLTHMFESNLTLPMTLAALRINYEMPRHTLGLLRAVLGGELRGRRVAVCGVAYLAEVPDTRNSPTQLLVEDLLAAGAIISLHDACVSRWEEMPSLRVSSDLRRCLEGAGGVVLAIPHRAYVSRTSKDWLAILEPGAAIVDAQNILDDSKAAALREAGHRLVGVGKGHWRKAGYER